MEFSFSNHYLGRLGKIEPTFFDSKEEKKDIKALAKYNANFAKMLKNLGWQI